MNNKKKSDLGFLVLSIATIATFYLCEILGAKALVFTGFQTNLYLIATVGGNTIPPTPFASAFGRHGEL